MRFRLYFVTIVAALGGFLFGFDTAVISGTDAFVVPYFHLDDAQWGFTVSSALFGTIIGALAAGYPADKLGRRNSLFITATLYLVSALTCAFAPNWASLVIGRVIGGVGVGLASVLSPMYIAEIAPAQSRGRLVAVSQLNIVMGILVAYFSNGYFSHLADNWRWMFGAQALPALAFFVLLFFVPQSPRWLVNEGREEEAREVLDGIYTDKNKSVEVINEIKQALHPEKVSFTSLFHEKFR
ncbi:MAG: MFS transporter, partial [Cyanobacteria bacterium]|nr:MFS transporter [Cyanobacteriota bacterium]